jgi:hypothetical protein
VAMMLAVDRAGVGRHLEYRTGSKI